MGPIRIALLAFCDRPSRTNICVICVYFKVSRNDMRRRASGTYRLRLLIDLKCEAELGQAIAQVA
eukprot:3723392-Pleurochrysis_carterae.AAC.5